MTTEQWESMGPYDLGQAFMTPDGHFHKWVGCMENDEYLAFDMGDGKIKDFHYSEVTYEADEA